MTEKARKSMSFMAVAAGPAPCAGHDRRGAASRGVSRPRIHPRGRSRHRGQPRSPEPPEAPDAPAPARQAPQLESC